MKHLKWIAACVALLAPASSFAVGASLSAGAGYLSEGNKPSDQLKLAFELAPFHEIGLVRIEVPVEMRLKPSQVWAVRPGIKVFLPVVSLYARAGYGFGNIRGTGGVTQSAILGVGWQFDLLDTVGIFLEGTGEPQIYPTSGPWVAMLRFGAMLNL